VTSPRRTAQATGDGKTAVVALRGLIAPRASWVLDFLGGTPLDWFTATMETLAGDRAVKEIIIDVDSPGGSVAGVQEAASVVRDLRDKKRIVAVANTLAASAAYWIASAASEVIASPSSELGSIGVFALHEDWSEANKKAGIVPTYVVSKGSPRKVDANPDQPLSARAMADIQEDVDEIYSRFVLAVTRNRGINYSDAKTAADGRSYPAGKAVTLKLADRIAPLRQVLVGDRSTPAGRAQLARLRSKYSLARR
jgi:signal peptide peptidase SppA